LRHKSITENWDVCPPRYDIDRYLNHYFHPDFFSLREKFLETEEMRDEKRRKAKYGEENSIRDFVPYKQAVRIREAITFCVKLDGRCLDLTIDSTTRAMLEDFDKACDDAKKEGKSLHSMEAAGYDYESFPVLRDHKISLLELMLKQAVDRKYKISFLKGMQIVFE